MSLVQDDATHDETEIRALILQGDQAHRDKDAAAFVAPYAPDALVADLAPPLFHRGVNRNEKQAWMDTWDGPIDRESRDFTITVSGDLAVGHGYFRLTSTPPCLFTWTGACDRRSTSSHRSTIGQFSRLRVYDSGRGRGRPGGGVPSP